MASYKKTSSERMRVLEAGAEEAAGVGAGGEGLLRINQGLLLHVNRLGNLKIIVLCNEFE